MPIRVDAVVFDLGGVLADFGGVEPMRALSGIGSDDELWRRWLSCDWVRRFERGQCSAEQFAEGVVADWQLPIDPTAFLSQFATWLVGPFDGAEELVREVSKHAVVACLSNTNAVHWEAGAAGWPLFNSFDHAFLSFQLGMVKPDPEIFEAVANTLEMRPERILFLDDNEINVTAARATGMRAERVRGLQEARLSATQMTL